METALDKLTEATEEINEELARQDNENNAETATRKMRFDSSELKDNAEGRFVGLLRPAERSFNIRR